MQLKGFCSKPQLLLCNVTLINYLISNDINKLLICFVVGFTVSSFFRYNILKILQPYGEIQNLELLFHKSGVKEGEPRGYCFVEFKTLEVRSE